MQAIGGLKSILERFTRVVAAGLVLLLLSAPASAVVIAVADPEDGFGESPDILTVDVYDETLDPPANYAQRGVAFDRRLRQTFQNPAAFNVGQITIAFNGEGGGVPGGFALRFYEVEDVLGEDADEFSPVNLIQEVLYDGVVPDTVNYLQFQLTGNSVFQLPARGTASDTLGYAIELSAPFPSPSEPSRGQIRFTNSGTDYYTTGRYYITDGASNDHRDIGISIVASDIPVFIPGDTNGDNIVDIDIDLAAILANFRTDVLTIQEGDLSGDGFVDFDDFDLWKTNYSGPIPAEALASLGIVPEPGSAALGLAVFLAGALRRRQRACS